MPNNFLTARNWRLELVLDMPAGRKSYGFWNRSELTFGADGQLITDPEDGKVPVGGDQTAENLTISRPFKRSRDRDVYRELKPVRGRVSGQAHVWELDDFDQPTSSQPIDSLDVVLLQVVLPEGDAGSSDPSIIAGELQVRP